MGKKANERRRIIRKMQRKVKKETQVYTPPTKMPPFDGKTTQLKDGSIVPQRKRERATHKKAEALLNYERLV